MDHEYKNPQKIVGLIVLLVLVGCMRSVTTSFGDAPDLKNWVSEVRARPAPPLEQLPVMQQFETFEYSAQGMRDPFSDAWVNPEGAMGYVQIRIDVRSRWKHSHLIH